MIFPRRRFLGSSLIVLGSALTDALTTPLWKWKNPLVVEAASGPVSPAPDAFGPGGSHRSQRLGRRQPEEGHHRDQRKRAGFLRLRPGRLARHLPLQWRSPQRTLAASESADPAPQ